MAVGGGGGGGIHTDSDRETEGGSELGQNEIEKEKVGRV